MAYQWQNGAYDGYYDQLDNGYYNPDFEDDVNRKRQKYPNQREFEDNQFQRNSYAGDLTDFDSREYQDFDSPRYRGFDLQRNGDVDTLKSRDFNSPRPQSSDSERLQDVRSRNLERKSSGANVNYGYRFDDEDHTDSVLAQGGELGGRSEEIARENRKPEHYAQKTYDDIDINNVDTTVKRRRNCNTKREGYDENDGGLDHETNITNHLQQNLDGKETVIIRKKRTRDNSDGWSESTSEFSHRKSRAMSRSVRKSGNASTLPSNGRRIKTKLETLIYSAKDQSDVAQVYRDQILQESEQSTHHLWRLRQKKAWQHFKQKVKDVLFQFELWSGAFKEIEGQFGTAVMTYFRFMRWLLFLNFYLMVIMLGLTMVPYLVLLNSPSDFCNTVPTNCTNYMNSSANSCNIVPTNLTNYINSSTDYDNYTVSKQDQFYEAAVKCTDEYKNFNSDFRKKERVDSQFLDVLQGTGWMEETVLFYGIYFNKTFSLPFVDGQLTYNMSLSYLMATGAAFLLSFLLIVKNTAKNVKNSAMDVGSGQVIQFWNKVYGGWDYCISNDKTATIKHKNLFQELRGDLDTQRLLWRRENKSKQEKAKLYGIRIVVNLVVLGFLIGSLTAIYFSNDGLIKLESLFEHVSPYVQTLIQFLPSVTITILNVIVPLIFNKLVEFEDYMPSFQMQITLLRTVILRLASLFMLMYSLYKMVVTHNEKFCADCGNKHWAVINETTEGVPIKCWETYVGQQIYKLVILDFLLPFILTFIIEYPRRFVYQKLHEKSKVVEMMGQQTFDLPKAVLDLVYTQTLCWMGLFFCPLIPVMSFAKCFIFFYVKKGTVMNNCAQPVRPYRTSTSNSLFIAILFISFIISTGPMIFLVGTISPSQSCGPFRVYSVDYFVFFNTIGNLVDSFPSKAQPLFYFMGTVAFSIPAIIVMCLVMYYFGVQATGYKRRAKLLREELKFVAKDKKYLLDILNEEL